MSTRDGCLSGLCWRIRGQFWNRSSGQTPCQCWCLWRVRTERSWLSQSYATYPDPPLVVVSCHKGLQDASLRHFTLAFCRMIGIFLILLRAVVEFVNGVFVLVSFCRWSVLERISVSVRCFQCVLGLHSELFSEQTVALYLRHIFKGEVGGKSKRTRIQVCNTDHFLSYTFHPNDFSFFFSTVTSFIFFLN